MNKPILGVFVAFVAPVLAPASSFSMPRDHPPLAAQQNISTLSKKEVIDRDSSDAVATPILQALIGGGGTVPLTFPAMAGMVVLYEDRFGTEAGTQRVGYAVWSVVQETPARGQPLEPVIRAVAVVPEEDFTLTLTIHHDINATIPTSPVVELMFDVPSDFSGGSVADLLQVALKPTEPAKGEPLTGTIRKLKEGLFVIAESKASKATTSNVDLLNKAQWIDIPIAYANGRRALMSIQKGVDGDRVFKEAIAAWGIKR